MKGEAKRLARKSQADKALDVSDKNKGKNKKYFRRLT